MSGKIIIGVTGEIGAGKTTFVEILEGLGGYPIYTDQIAHRILNLKRVKKKLEELFGEDIFEGGKINRQKLAGKAFEDVEKWSRLIYATHPYILKRIFKTIEKTNYRYYVIDAPLLFESDLDEICDFIILIKASPENRRRRLKGKINWQEAKRRSKYLIPVGLKEKLADFIVNNDKTKRRLVKDAEEIWRRIQTRAKGPRSKG